MSNFIELQRRRCCFPFYHVFTFTFQPLEEHFHFPTTGRSLLLCHNWEITFPPPEDHFHTTGRPLSLSHHWKITFTFPPLEDRIRFTRWHLILVLLFFRLRMENDHCQKVKKYISSFFRNIFDINPYIPKVLMLDST